MKKDLLSAAAGAFLLVASVFLVAGCNGSGSSSGTGGGDTSAALTKVPPEGGRTATTVMVTFGNPTRGGCTGKGACQAVSMQDSLLAQSGSIPAVFWYNLENDPNTVNIEFNLGVLNASLQSTNQSSFFGPNATSYQFDMPYDVSVDNTMFMTLGIPSGNIIGPASTSQLHFVAATDTQKNALQLVKTIPYTGHAIFGYKDNKGKWKYDSGGTGILALYHDARQQTGDTPATTPVTFKLLPGNASTLLISFRQATLAGNESGQGQLWPAQNNQSAGGGGNFPFPDELISSVQLPVGSLFPSIVTRYTFVQQTGMIVDTLPNYGYAMSLNTDDVMMKKKNAAKKK